jgi:hypothetical protein
MDEFHKPSDSECLRKNILNSKVLHVSGRTRRSSGKCYVLKLLRCILSVIKMDYFIS